MTARRSSQLLLLLGLLIWIAIGLPGPAGAASGNTLVWQDNSTNEANFTVERTTAAAVPGCASAVGFVPIATVGANVTTFSDTAVAEGTTYCYRVNASNPGGVSGYSNIAGRTVPFSIPGAPSALTVGP